MTTASAIKPIETRYRGCRFRSRLEARYAVLFDALGYAWEYEPEGFELASGARYLPDFRVLYPGRDESERHAVWFEVKGDLRQVTTEEWGKLLEFQQQASGPLMVLDGTPDTRMYIGPDLILANESGDLTYPPRVQPEALQRERTGWALWSGKGRLWWDNHSDYFTPYAYGWDEESPLEHAVRAARSARFEFGETGEVTR